MGEKENEPFQFTFNGLLKVEFQASRVTSDAGLILVRELTARRLGHFKKTVILYPICMLAIWLPSVFLGVTANAAREVPAIESKLEVRTELAAGATHAAAERDRLRAQAAGDDVILRLVEGLRAGFAALFWRGSTKWGALASTVWTAGAVLTVAVIQQTIPPPPGAPVPVWSAFGTDIVTRSAAGAMVLGCLPVVPMPIVSALLVVVVSWLTPASVPRRETLARYRF